VLIKMLHKRKDGSSDDVYVQFGSSDFHGEALNVHGLKQDDPKSHLDRKENSKTYGTSEKRSRDSAVFGNDSFRNLTGNSPNIPESQQTREISGKFCIFLTLASPYFKESKSGRCLFYGILLLALLNGGVVVLFSYLNRDFWNALSEKNVDSFYLILERFMLALLFLAPIKVIYRFQQQKLSIKWREWMTDRVFQLYQSNRVYYSLERGGEVDNPDQRIAQDVRNFTVTSLTLFLEIMTSTIDLVCFSVILFSIRAQLFLAIFLFATTGSLLTYCIGKKLIGLNFESLQKEADFRYSLVRIRDNAESIAFYGGEDTEGKEVSHRLQTVIGNMKELNVAQRNLDFFTTIYNYSTWILPLVVMAPAYFEGNIQIGVVTQASSAFSHVLQDLSIIINQFDSLSGFIASIDRLYQFVLATNDENPTRESSLHLMSLPDNLKQNEHFLSPHISSRNMIKMHQMDPLSQNNRSIERNDVSLVIENLSLPTPDRKRLLISNLSITTRWKENLLITGASGSGKSSLLRAIAGLWTAGSGAIYRPNDEDIYFLPQRPYCSLGTLRDQLLYPYTQSMDKRDFPEGHRLSSTHLVRNKLDDSDLLKILDEVNLSSLAQRTGDGDPYRGLNAVLDWSNTLSLGEQQRLAFGRVLVNRPCMIIMDESTSALDVASERTMYELLQNMNKVMGYSLSYISVGHRPSLFAHHDVRLHIKSGNEYSVNLIDDSVKATASLDTSDIFD
jgi:putative ATP-binding cassette transporter